VIAKNVTENLYDRHIVPVFFGGAAPAVTAVQASAGVEAR
jgi:hypothetical protein